MRENKIVEKSCKYCGTTDDLMTDSLGRVWCVCRTCRIEKTRKSSTGKKASSETLLKLSAWQKGIPKSEEHCESLSKAHMGKKPTQETRDKMRESHLGEKNHFFGKTHEYDSCLKMSESSKYTLKDYQEKHPLICLVEKFRESPHEIGKSGVQVQCKRCNEWFTPTYQMIVNRENALMINKDNHYFYCSDDCKNSCPLFRLRPDKYISDLNKEETNYSSNYDLDIWKKEVLNRQLKELNICFNHCEICNSEVGLHVHHEKPQKTHPHLAIDPDNGIILCSLCHYSIGHRGDCSTGSLANMICSPIIS